MIIEKYEAIIKLLAFIYWMGIGNFDIFNFYRIYFLFYCANFLMNRN
jgi:hypothetical protein